MLPRLPTIAFLSLTLIACGPGGPPAPAGVAYGLPDPAVVTYVTGDTTRMDIDAGGQRLGATASSSGTFRTTFTRVEDGVQVSMTFEDFSARLTNPMGAPQTADESAVTGPLIFTLDRQGRVDRVTEPQLVGAGVGFVQPLTMAHTFFPRVPGGPVPAGDTWQDTVRFEGTTSAGQEVSTVTALTYTVVGDTVVRDRSLIHVRAEGTTQQTSAGAIAGQMVRMSTEGTAAGFYLWDAQRGLMTEHVMNLDTRGTMNVAVAPFPLTVRARSEYRARLRDG